MTDERRKAKATAIEAGAVEMTVQEWLGLSDVEMAIIELRVRLAREVKRRREEAGMGRKALAERIGSSQPGVAKVEGGQAGESLDHLISAYLATGAKLSGLAAVVGGT